MANSVEIRSSAFPYDMSSWCVEKTSDIVQELVKIASLVNARETMSNELREEVLSSVSCALWDATKMLAFSCGEPWEPSDRTRLLGGDELAFEELKVKYGLLTETSAQQAKRRRIHDMTEFISSCRVLLNGERSPNRTLLHALIRRTYITEPLIDTLDEMLENVTMGQTDWRSFVEQARPIVAQLEQMYRSESDGAGDHG